MMLRLLAAGDLVRHYAAVTSAAWSARKQLQGPRHVAHELAFLPASLESAETPVHPAPRWAMLSIAGFALAVALIGFFGQLDIVAVAKGKLVPSARVKVIQPAVTGVVRRILVRDGQRVAEGELLMDLDPTQAAADSSKARSSRVSAALAEARASALLDAQQKGRTPRVSAVADADDEMQRASQRLAEGMAREYADKLAAAASDLSKREAELQSTRHEINKLRATAPLARQQADRYHALVDRQYVAQSEYLDKEQSALQQEHELTVQGSHAHELEAAVAEQRAGAAGIASQFRREQLDALDRARQQLAQNRDDETKTTTRQALMTLKAPVAGTVQQLAVHTTGGVVTTAQALMEIVPDDAVELEVTFENKDVGFVRQGQDAVVKIDAFPYTRYGTLTGRLEGLSNDAVADRKLGLSFVGRVRLTASRIAVNNRWVDLTPGMSATAEINTGTRSVAAYFLDPLVQTGQESLRER